MKYFISNFRILFLIFSVFYLFIEIAELDILRFFTKPLLLISLSIYFYWQTKGVNNTFSKFIQGGLFFSLLGDTVLLFVSVEQFYFVVGLVMFLIAHVCYIVAFTKNSSQNKIKTSLQFKLTATLPFILLSGSVFFILKDSLGALLIPVAIYISVITVMGIFAALRYKKVSPVSFNFILIGAIFFMLSDTLLAFNKFTNPLPLAGFLIMSTYIVAQYLIAEGSIEQLKK